MCTKQMAFVFGVIALRIPSALRQRVSSISAKMGNAPIIKTASTEAAYADARRYQCRLNGGRAAGYRMGIFGTYHFADFSFHFAGFPNVVALGFVVISE